MEILPGVTLNSQILMTDKDGKQLEHNIQLSDIITGFTLTSKNGNVLASDGKIMEHDDIVSRIILKRPRGRPRNSDIVTQFGVNRKNKVNNIYLKNRYHTDPEFREKCKQRRRDHYAQSLLGKDMKRVSDSIQFQSNYNSDSD